MFLFQSTFNTIVLKLFINVFVQGSLGRAFGKKVKEELNKQPWDMELDSPKVKRTSAPIVVESNDDDIPDQIKELDEAIKQASS